MKEKETSPLEVIMIIIMVVGGAMAHNCNAQHNTEIGTQRAIEKARQAK